MGWFDGFPFKSKEQTQREQKEFEQRVFPLGLAQRDEARKVLAELVHVPRMGDNERLYAFIAAKDAYVKSGKGADGIKAARQQLVQMRWVDAENQALIIAFVRMEAELTSLGEYPGPEDVRAYAALAAQDDDDD